MPSLVRNYETNAFELAQRFVGIKEVAGSVHNPHIVAMLRLDQSWPGSDEVPWCSAFVNYIAWLLRMPRSHSLAARSWLQVGTPIELADATQQFDVVVLKGAGSANPDAPGPGHVGFFAGIGAGGDRVLILGGNQQNRVQISAFPILDVLGVRRISMADGPQ